MTAPVGEEFTWRRSARSAGNGCCVEVALLGDGVAVRDSKDPEGPTLAFAAPAWKGFLASLSPQRD